MSKIKNIIGKWALEKLKKFLSYFNPSQRAWLGASLGVTLITLIIWAVNALSLFKNDHYFAVSFYFLCGLLLAFLICCLILFLITLFLKLPLPYQLATGSLFIIIYFAFPPYLSLPSMTLLFVIAAILGSLLGGSFASFFSSKKTYLMNALLFLTAFVAILLLAAWLVYEPPSFKMQDLAFKGKFNEITLPDPASKGPFEVEKFSYGSGKDRYRAEYGNNARLITQPVDGSSFLSEWSGWDGWLRTWYWGFDPQELPLNARVWLPKGEGPFPLVLIVHGNHEMEEFSDTGYEYLGDLFSSHGFITASIDENFLNSSWFQLGELSEGTARGWLLLEHLKAWRQWNESTDTILSHKIDMEHIALIGHSRGGEAIGIAAALNPLRYYPDDATIEFNYGFNIRSLAAIAPVDGYEISGGFKINLDNINYFVLHGSNDGDVRSFEGTAQYERIKFHHPSSYYFKSALYIFGANHGQFNQTWGLRDVPPPASAFYAFGNIMPEKEQQQIAKVYLTAFLKATLNNEKGYMPLFRNSLTGKNWLPHTLYLNQFEDSTTQFIISGRDHLDITKIALPGGSQIGENLETWRQGEVLLKQGTFLNTAIFLGWSHCENPSHAIYTITLPENALKIDKKDALFLSLAELNDVDNEDTLSCNRKGPIDFTIELTDKNGQKATVVLSSFAYLQPPFKVEMMKSSLFGETQDSEVVFQTFQYPLADFVANNPQLNPQELHTIRFIFDRTPSGLIAMDKLGLIHQ